MTLAQGAAHLSIADLGKDGHVASAVDPAAGRRDADAVVAVKDTVTIVDDGRKIDGITAMVIPGDTTEMTVGGATGGMMNGEEAVTMTAVAATTSVKRPERRS